MSAEQPRQESVAWQSTNTPARKVVSTVTMYWDDLRESLPVPGYAWRWGETGLTHKCLYRLKEHDMVKQSAVGSKRWETTEELWCYVISRASDDEDVGEVVGQKTLTGAQSPREAARSDAWRTGRKRDVGRQATLTGDATTDVDRDSPDPEDSIETNAAKSSQGDEDRGARCVPLTVTVEDDLGKWSQPTVSTRSLATPTGRVY